VGVTHFELPKELMTILLGRMTADLLTSFVKDYVRYSTETIRSHVNRYYMRSSQFLDLRVGRNPPAIAYFWYHPSS